MNIFKMFGLKKQSKRTPDSAGRGSDEDYDPDNPRLVQVQANDGTIHTLPEDHPSLHGSQRPSFDSYQDRTGKSPNQMTPFERRHEEARQQWRGHETVRHFDQVNDVRRLKAQGKDVPEELNQYDPAHPDFTPLTRDILGYDPHYPEWDEAQPETPATVPAIEQIQTSKKVRTPELETQ